MELTGRVAVVPLATTGRTFARRAARRHRPRPWAEVRVSPTERVAVVAPVPEGGALARHVTAGRGHAQALRLATALVLGQRYA